ncbi:endonuclease domain-containing protein [Demequina flava]|uniref:endonuclease domain-containing protein n=1 Tax=Demequina flava TaxID=1095025 RepID=UPI000B132AD1|nr:DUF559 domain-containing protein [Demequina flava]
MPLASRPKPISLEAFLNHEPRVLSREQAVQRWGRRALDGEVAAGTVVRLLPDVYCGRELRADPIVWALGLNLWHPAGLVTGGLALHLHRPQLPAPSLASIRVASGFRPRARDWVACIQGIVPETEGYAQGVRTVPTAWALVDAWRTSPPQARRNIFYEAFWARAFGLEYLRRIMEVSPRLPGRAELLRLIDACEAGATTPLERIAQEETFVRPPFDEFEWQATLDLGHRRVRPDMLHRKKKVIVELDGARYHESRTAQSADHERDIDLAAAGYTTLRFGWRDLTKRPAWCRRRVIEVLERRS